MGFHVDVFIHKFILLEVAYNESKDRIQYLLFNVWKTRYLRNRLQYLRKPWVNVFFFRYLHRPITPSLVIFLINNIWPDFGELLATPLKTIHKFHLIDWNVWFEIFKIYTVKSWTHIYSYLHQWLRYTGICIVKYSCMFVNC